MRWRKASVVLTATLALGGAYWVGCGDDDDDGAFFVGNVSSVTGGSTAAHAPRDSSLFAELGRSLASAPFVSLAHAQSSCTAPSGNLLFCVDEFCTRVDDDCEFARLVPVEGGGPIFVTLHFVDDTNEDGTADFDEDDAVVDEISVCNGDQILVRNAAINFDGTSTATVTKTVDNCSGTSPTPTGGVATPTPTPTGNVPTTTPTTPAGGTATPTIPAGGTATPTLPPGATPTTPAGGTPTPTYGVAMSDAPLPSFAFFASVAAIGLLLPGRRRRKRDGA